MQAEANVPAAFKTSPLHEWVAARMVAARGQGIWRTLYRALLRWRDAPVGYVIGKARVVLPASHALPLYQHLFPNYDRALGRLTRTLRAVRGDGEVVVVDVGANVGDTAVAMLQQPGVFVVAIDGNPAFTPYLRHNLARYADRSFVAETFIGPDDASDWNVETDRGTARLVRSADKQPRLGFASMRSILEAAGKQRVDLIKVDTDGFDIAIIRDSLDVIERTGATLFFEFDPTLFTPVTPDGWTIFRQLAQVGYEAGIVYLNTGEFLRSFALKNPSALMEFSAVLNGPTCAYIDVAVFRDRALFSRCLTNELRHFAPHAMGAHAPHSVTR